MLIRALVIFLVLPAALAGSPAGRSRHDARANPVSPLPVPVAPERVAHDASCYETFINTGVPGGIYFPAGTDVEVLDDLHLGPVVVSKLCAFDFGYYKSGPGATSATVTFYVNNPGDSLLGLALASMVLPGLPTGENAFHVEMPGSSLAQDIWLGVSFSTPDAGLEVADPAWPGASDDVFLMRPPNEYYNFGGNPKANFLLGVYATSDPGAVNPGPDWAHRSGFRDEPWPNPSAAGIGFRFASRLGGPVRAEVLDVAGRRVAVIADRQFAPGIYRISWDGRTQGGNRAAAGVYLVRLTMPGFSGTRKFVMVR